MKLGELLILVNRLTHLQPCKYIIPGENQLQRQNLQSRQNIFNLPIENLLIIEGAARATPSFYLRTQL